MSGDKEERERCNLALYVLIKMLVHLCKGTVLFPRDQGERSPADGAGDQKARVMWQRSGQLWVCGLRLPLPSRELCPSVCPRMETGAVQCGNH